LRFLPNPSPLNVIARPAQQGEGAQPPWKGQSPSSNHLTHLPSSAGCVGALSPSAKPTLGYAPNLIVILTIAGRKALSKQAITTTPSTYFRINFLIYNEIYREINNVKQNN